MIRFDREHPREVELVCERSTISAVFDSFGLLITSPHDRYSVSELTDCF